MSYIGNTQQNQSYVPAVDFFNGNGSTVAFTLSRPVASVAQVQVVVSNVPQKPGDAYTVSGNTITFTSAPPSGSNNVYVYYTSPNVSVNQPSDGSVVTSKIATGAVTTAKIADASITAAKVASGQVLSLNGITFPATQVSSSDANTLDDYEEGTFTPTLSSGVGVITSYSANGRYTKIGRVVTITVSYTITNNGSGGGYGSIGSFPFAASGSFTGVDRIGATTGSTCTGVLSDAGVGVAMWTYSNTYPWATNATGNFTLTYFTS